MQNPEICDCKTRLLIFGGNQYQTSNTNETTKLRSMSGITKNTEKDEKNNFFFLVELWGPLHTPLVRSIKEKQR